MVTHNKPTTATMFCVGVVGVAVSFSFGWYVRGSDNFADSRNHELYRMNETLSKIADNIPPQKTVTVVETKKIYEDAAIRNRGLYIEQDGAVYDPPSDAEIIFTTGCVSWKGGTVSTWENPLDAKTTDGKVKVCGTYKLVFTEQAYCGDIQYCTNR